MKRNRPLNQEKRDAIIKASINEFYQKGYEASSMDTIAKEANVSKATVYNHFNTKEELFFNIAQIFMDKFEKSFQYTYSKDKDIKEQLKDIAKKEIEFLSIQENITLIQIVTVMLIQRNEIGIKLIEQKNGKEINIEMTKKWLEDAKADKKLNFDDPYFVAKQFIGMIKSFAFYPQLYGAPLINKKEADTLIEKSVEMILSQYKVKCPILNYLVHS